MGLLYKLDPMVKEIYDGVMMCLGSNGCFGTSAPCLNEGHGYSFACSVGHPRLNSIGLLVYGSMRTLSKELMYYRSLKATPM
jgi:hypothetical protein